MNTKTLLVICLPLLLAHSWAGAAEYFVSKQGDDANDGRNPEAAFATIQRGVDALEPGDTLTIGPGEYTESVWREDLGGPDADTLIRAKLPGTVLMRGDRPAPELRKLEGYRFVYVTDFDTEAHVVNELDTLSVMEAVPNVDEVEFTPGTFHQDMDTGKLYLSASDLASTHDHQYTITVSGTHGIYLRNAQRVTIEGIAVTGYNRFGFRPRGDGDHGATGGIFLVNSRHCVVRACYAYFNGRGIVVNSSSDDSGDNVIERCVAWANASRYGGSFGGLTLYQPRRDIIRDSVAFRNGHKGVNIRVSGDAARRGQTALSYLAGNVSWGNPIDIRIKAASSGHVAERNVAMSPIEWFESSHNLFGSGRGAGSNRLRSADTIMLEAESDLDPHQEFADPDNFDYRLQPDSRFRGTGPDGADQGPFPYHENVYYVSPQGDDSADGLSSATAWRSIARAVQALEAGDTLYLEAGVYDQPLRWTGGAGDADQPIAVRGRGTGNAVIRGPVHLERGRHIEFERLNFTDPVSVRNSEAIRFQDSRFTGAGVSLQASRVQGLRVTHSEFTGFRSAALELRDSAKTFLSGNIFDNVRGPAVRTDAADAILYSDYNSYRDADEVWTVNDAVWNDAELGSRFEQHIRILAPRYHLENGVAELRNADDFAVSGPRNTPLGVYLPQRRYAADDTLHVDGPAVHSVTATTANIEWWSSRPETFTVRWGKTPEVEHARTLSPINPYHPHGMHLDKFNSFSLTGLQPATQYHFRLERDGIEYGTLTFTTASESLGRRTLFVAPDGDNAQSGLDRDSAWRTVTHAADQARPGDTVLIAGGVYHELVRIRATGKQGAPITFTPVPGEKVVFDGSERRLHSAFNVFNKSHIHVDGLYFQNFGRIWTRGLFYLVRSRDITITRCFADGRSRGTNPELVVGGGVENLLIRNCVLNRGWGFIAMGTSSDIRVENSVIFRVDINTIGLSGNVRDFTIRNSIITDNLSNKASAALVAPRHSPENNVFFLRVPEQDRSVFGSGGGSIAEYNREHHLDRPNLLANPRFAALADDPDAQHGDLFTDAILGRIDDFPDAFATNPELIERGIGLIPDDFEDFHQEK